MAKRNFIYQLKNLVKIVAFWVIAFIIYDVIRFSGISSVNEVAQPLETFSWLISIEFACTIGVITGLLYFFVEAILENHWFVKQTYGFRILVKAVFYFLILLADSEIGINLIAKAGSSSKLVLSQDLLHNEYFLSFSIYFILCSTFFSFLKIVHEKFGPGVFWKMLIGKYTPPRIEKKIFMFLDMKSSTTIAEKIGFEKFSSFVQECFIDLNQVLPHYHGEIYQYVGDEAIIVWDFKQGVNPKEHLALFFEFEEKLKSRSDFYMNEYGFIPEFKAGIHGGELVVAEVGIVKKEIAYHGDVINTTARIQDLCNSLNEKLLISAELLEDTEEVSGFKFINKGKFLLRGKEADTTIFGIQFNSIKH